MTTAQVIQFAPRQPVECARCGMSFYRPIGRRGRPRTKCEECAPSRTRESSVREDRPVNYDMLARMAHQRGAIEAAKAAIRVGRPPSEVLAYLEGAG